MEGFVAVAFYRGQVKYGNDMISQQSLASRENIAPPRYLAKQYLVIFGTILIWLFGSSNILQSYCSTKIGRTAASLTEVTETLGKATDEN